MDKKDIELLKEYCEKRFDAIDKQLDKLDAIVGMTKDVRSDMDAIKKDNEDIQKSLQDMLK
ncbi:hypothetical protein COL70_17340 [Bacillus pseudomycoides]|uniref:hypothetical protein n=1 Tax=Bacillus pseudomycoides TaxID=64104 RepID=UPI000BF7FA17|nr:hypothetical protein [Bacillus pseudomycoides]PFZ89515.1 hypothetical protein COL70_17340 [Bacillus pseudomycoides]